MIVHSLAPVNSLSAAVIARDVRLDDVLILPENTRLGETTGLQPAEPFAPRWILNMDEVTLTSALRAYGEAMNLAEPLRVRFWLERGLTLAQIETLFLLCERDGQAVGELAAAMQTRPPTVTGLTDRLEQHGFARRTGDPSTAALSAYG